MDLEQIFKVLRGWIEQISTVCNLVKKCKVPQGLMVMTWVIFLVRSEVGDHWVDRAGTLTIIQITIWHKKSYRAAHIHIDYDISNFSTSSKNKRMKDVGKKCAWSDEPSFSPHVYRREPHSATQERISDKGLSGWRMREDIPSLDGFGNILPKQPEGHTVWAAHEN